MNIKKVSVVCTILCFLLTSVSAVLALTEDYSSEELSEESASYVPYTERQEPSPTYYASYATPGSEQELYKQPYEYYWDQPVTPQQASHRTYPRSAFGPAGANVKAPDYGRDTFAIDGMEFNQQRPTGHGRYLLDAYDNTWEESRAVDVWSRLFHLMGTPYTYAFESPYYSERRQTAPYGLAPKNRKLIYGFIESGRQFNRVEKDPKLRSIYQNVYGIEWDKPLQRYLVDEYGPSWQVNRDKEVFTRLSQIYGNPYEDIRNIPLVHSGTMPELRAFRTPHVIRSPIVNMKKDLLLKRFWDEVGNLNLGLLRQYDHNWGILAFQKGAFIMDLVNPYEVTWNRRIISDDILLESQIRDSMQIATLVQDPFDDMKKAQYYGDMVAMEDLYDYWTSPGTPSGISSSEDFGLA